MASGRSDIRLRSKHRDRVWGRKLVKGWTNDGCVLSNLFMPSFGVPSHTFCDNGSEFVAKVL